MVVGYSPLHLNLPLGTVVAVVVPEGHAHDVVVVETTHSLFSHSETEVSTCEVSMLLTQPLYHVNMKFISQKWYMICSTHKKCALFHRKIQLIVRL